MYNVKKACFSLLFLGFGLACQAPEQAEETEASSSELKKEEEAQRANPEQESDPNTSSDAAQESQVPQPQPRPGFKFAEGTQFTLQTKQNDDGGWAYVVLMNGKQMINQAFIPGVQGKQSFTTEEDAQKVGELVKSKLENNIMPPSVRLSELDSLGIVYK